MQIKIAYIAVDSFLSSINFDKLDYCVFIG